MIVWNVIQRASVASTMDEIDILGEAGAPSGTVVVAGKQTSGRGRAGRVWSAPPGSALFLSMLYRPDLAVSALASLPLHVGVATAEAIDAVARSSCRLKWPNDVLIDGDKIAGILVTTKLQGDGVRFANIGIGINCTALGSELPPGAASILSATGRHVPPGDVLPVLLERLGARLDQFEAAKGRPSLTDWWDRAAFRGELVRLINDGVETVGMLAGIDSDGALLLTDERGERIRVVAGDLTRGPRRAGDF